MQQNQIPKYATKPISGYAEVVNADGAAALYTDSAAYKTLYTCPAAPNGGGGALIDQLKICSNDTVARVAVLAIKVGSTIRHLGVINIPINSGANGTVVAVDALDNSVIKGLPLNSQGKRYFRLVPGQSLVIGTLAAVTASTRVTADCTGMEFLDNPA
jgi:hypothetical protein